MPPVVSRSALLRWLVLAVFGYSIWRTVLPEFSFALGTDEGLYIHGAQRVLRGELPNRDFFSFIPPVSYAVLALVAWLRGAFVAADARLVAAMGSLIAAFVYAHLLSRGWDGPKWPLYGFSLALAICFETGPGSNFSFSHHNVSMLFGAVSLLVYAPALREGRKASASEIRASGLAASLCVMTTTNLGVYLCVALSLWLLIDEWREPQPFRVPSALIRLWLWFASLPVVYVCAHLLLHNGRRLYRELVEFVLFNYAIVNTGKLDYFFFFRLRLNAAISQYHAGGVTIDSLQLLGSTLAAFLGHLPALALAAVALFKVRTAEGPKRAFYRTSLLLAVFYAASLATAVTNPFVPNITTHSLPAFVLLAAWVLRPMAAADARLRGGFRGIEMVAAAASVVWVLALPNWRRDVRTTVHTPLGDLTCGFAPFCEGEQAVLSLLGSAPPGTGLVAYHYYAPRWYAYFPDDQRLEFSVLVPFYSPTSHYEQAVAAMRSGRIRYVVEDKSFELNRWDKRLPVVRLKQTNGAAFYRYVRQHGRTILANDFFTVRDLETTDGNQPRKAAAPADARALVPQPRQEF